MELRSRISPELEGNGYVFVAAEQVRELVDPTGEHLEDFAGHWNDLRDDPYLGGEYVFRRRRFAQLGLVPAEGRLWRREHGKFFQSSDLNQYAGGIDREFAPIEDRAIASPVFQGLVTTSFSMFEVEPEFQTAEWHVDVHFFRLRVDTNRVSEPTPEGIHRDGYPFGVLHLMGRQGVEGGISHIYDLDEKLLDVHLFERRLDTLYAYDNRIKHYATPLYAQGMDEGHRDLMGYVFYLPGTKYDKG